MLRTTRVPVLMSIEALNLCFGSAIELSLAPFKGSYTKKANLGSYTKIPRYLVKVHKSCKLSLTGNTKTCVLDVKYSSMGYPPWLVFLATFEAKFAS